MARLWVATIASLTTQTLANVSQFTPPERVSNLTFTLKNEIIRLLETKERTLKMSANIYTVEDLLIGKTYRSNTLTGEIISAEKHPKAVWYKDCESYLVEVKSYELGNPSYSFRTIAVKDKD